MFTKNVLPNGLRVILSPMPQVKSLTALVMVAAGSRYENERNNGISHFLEHMMFKGTKKRPSTKEIAQLFDGIGASYNAFTSKEYTGFYVKAAAQHRELMLDVLSDIVLRSTYEASELERERGVITSEINGDEDEPSGRVFQIFEKMLFSGSPLEMRVSGEKENIARITREEVVNYVGKMYHSHSMLVALAGAVAERGGENETRKLVEKYFGGVEKGPENEFLPTKTKGAGAQVKVYPKKTEQAHFCLGVPGYSLFDPKRYGAGVLSIILGGNMSSRLFIEVRDRRGLAYYISSFTEGYLDTGFFIVHGGVRLEKVEEAVTAIVEEMRRIRDGGVTAEELRRAKDYSAGKMILGLEDSFGVASFFAGQELLKKKIETPEEVLSQIEVVTVDDVQSIAEDIFKTRNLNLALIGPFKDKGKFEKILQL